MPNLSTRNQWKALFGLWTLHGLLSLAQLLVSQNQPFHLSIEEALLAGVLLSWTVFNGFLILSLSRNPAPLIQRLDLIKRPSAQDSIFILATLALFAQVCLGIFQSIADKNIFRIVGYLDRLAPLLGLTAMVLAEIIALILFVTFREKIEDKKSLKSFSVKLLIVVALLAVTVFYIAQTGMGIDPIYKGDWARGQPAVPLLEWQILLSCIFCAGAVLAENQSRISKISHPDLWIALAVWAFTVVLWLSQPVVPNSSALEPLDPNFEIYPFSDAQTYDEFAQSLLIGNGFGGEIPQRPLYVVFLTLFHLIAGQNYENVIILQSLILALFPVLLYLFGREFFGRPIGISIALLAALRDYTSNLVSPFTGNITHSKLYLSEIPTAMLLVLFLWIGLRWIKAGFPAFPAFLMGGILGTAMLVRTQVVTAFPVLLLFAFFVQPKKVNPIFKGALLVSITMLLTVSPWLWRNWRMTGELIFDNPGSQIANLALRYNRLNGVAVNILPLPGESDSEYNARLVELADQAMEQNPAGIARGIFNSFLNHGVNNILLLPLRNTLKDIGEVWTPANPFWQKWEGRPTTSQSMLLTFYILLFGLGVTTAWQRNGWMGFLPLGVNLIYNLWTSIALLSGQRFMVSMDWSIYLYYAIGLFALVGAFLFTLERGRTAIVGWYENNFRPTAIQTSPTGWHGYILAGMLFLGIGSLLPLMETIFPEKYSNAYQAGLSRAMLESASPVEAGISTACLQEILARNDVAIRYGRALYPRYYEPKGGEAFTDSFGYKVSDEGRLVFTLLQQKQSFPRIVFPMEQSPSFFPHASDVILISGDEGTVWFAFTRQDGKSVFHVSDNFDASTCAR